VFVKLCNIGKQCDIDIHISRMYALFFRELVSSPAASHK